MRVFHLISFLLFSIHSYSQLTDNFSDGDFTNGPSWTGDAAEFTVNPSFQLQLNNTVAGASYLSTPVSTSLDNLEWNFYIKLSFAPSSSNYARVYLVSDQVNLEGPLNGYYLQFGEAGSLDAVQLFKQTGTTGTSILRGTDAQIAASFAIRVKVIRDAAGLWKLYIDYTGGTSYSLEASSTETTYSTTSFFGVAAVYTLSNITKVYFDDFYVGPIIVDNTPPSINSISVLSANAISVVFSEPVDLTSSQTLTNYSVNNGVGNPSQVIKTSSNVVELTFANGFSDGVLNTLTVTNVQDVNGNAINSVTSNFTYFAPVIAVFKDLIITEFMADPSPRVDLPEVEFVELFNRSNKIINLKSWTFSDPSTTSTFPEVVINPGEYLIVTKASDTALFANFGKRVGLPTFPSLNNTGDRMFLKNKAGEFIDSVNYSLSWYNDESKDDGGWTLELINPNYGLNCPVSSNWTASNNPQGGTPGTQNSVFSTVADVIHPIITSVTAHDPLNITVCFSEPLISIPSFIITNGLGTPFSVILSADGRCASLVLSNPLTEGIFYTIAANNSTDCSGNSGNSNFNFVLYKPKAYDVVINEIMADPSPVVGLPDYEYVELFNRTKFPINLKDWKFTAGTNTKSLPDVTLAPESLIVLTSTTAAPLYNGVAVAGVTSFPTLTNSGQTLVLSNSEGRVIHTVSYTDKWYVDVNKVEGGWSLEMINPDNPCGESANWRASVNPLGGTLGRANSVKGTIKDHGLPQVVRVAVRNPSLIQLYFSEALDSLSLRAATYSVDHNITITSIDPVGPSHLSVFLTLSNPLTQDVIYTISVSSVKDCAGNSLGANSSVRFAIPEPALPKDIVINEILANPVAGGVDFVEIYNNSNKVLDLKSLNISSIDTVAAVFTSVNRVSSSGYLFFPGDFVVLTADPSAVKMFYHIKNQNAFLTTKIPSLNIASGTVVISDTTGTIIDKVTYLDQWHFPLLDNRKGVSLERIDYNRSSSDKTNWHSASETSGFATPGYQNSQYVASETGSKVTLSPETFSPDNDGYNDVLNISYSFDSPGFIANIVIFDSYGRTIRNLVKNELLGATGTFSWDGINENNEKAKVGIYIIYFEIFNTSGVTKAFKKPCVLVLKQY